MKINYTCYSIRKFFLIFLAITCQVGIINASISDIYQIYLNSKNLNEILTLLQNKDGQKPINHDTGTFINEIKTEILKETAFQLAITEKNDELVQELLKFKQLDVNQVINPRENKKKHQTALIRSIQLGKYDVAKGIVNHPRFDLEKQNRHPIQILIDIIHLASSDENTQKEQLALVELLIKKTEKKLFNGKYSFSKEISELKSITLLMYTILMLCNRLIFDSVTATQRDFLLKVIPLVIQSSDMAVTTDIDHKPTALIIAIGYYYENTNDPYEKKFKKQILPLMLQSKYVNQKSGLGSPPIIFAIKREKEALVKKLLNVKDIDVDIEDEEKKTAIFHAIENYNKGVFKLILDATKNLNHKNEKGQTPFVALINETFDDQAAHQDAIQKLAQKLKGKGQLDYRPDKNAPTALHSLVLFYIDQFQSLKEMVADEKNKLKKKLKNSVIAKPKYDSEISELEDKVKKYKENLNTASITNMNILVDAGADPTITFEDKDGQEKTAISLITDDLVEEHEELGTLKSSLEEAKENYKKRKEKNKDTSTQDQDPSQNQDEGNGMNIGTVVIIIAAVGSLVVGAIVAVPLLFKKQKATKKDNKQSKDNTAKPKSIST